jgi:EAL domain-containing protein (putative c-di-GMP-specific phosphodiesterase class I)
MGLVHSFTSWMLREALEQRERWAAAGMPVQLHVNLFQRDWRDEKLMTLLDEAAGTYRPSQGWLTLEIPQAHLTGDPEVIVGHLENLRRRGVSLLVDQVGTADSSLALLSRLPITGLKVDAAFVRRPVDRRKSVAIFHILVELAHRLGLAAFVEGIEEEEEVSAAREIGCDAAQGFFFSPPIPAFAIPEKIASIADRPVH